MSVTPPSSHLTRAVLGAMMTCVMILFSLWVIRPFLPATIWAMTIGITTWPLLLSLQKILWGSRPLAIAVTTLFALMVFVLPFFLAALTVIQYSSTLIAFAHSTASFRIPPEPAWLTNMPYIGPYTHSAWHRIENTRLPQLLTGHLPSTNEILRWLLNNLGGFSMLTIQFLLMLVIMAFMHAKGEKITQVMLGLGYSLAGIKGQNMMLQAGHTIRGVAIAVTITALAETAVAGAGLIATDVPGATVLTAITFMVCLLQAGPGLTLIPIVIWMFIAGNPLKATILMAITIVTIAIDNLLRPYLIRKQASIPLILIMVGVMGGLTGFGLIGIFIGPVILSVTYTLIKSWLETSAPVTPASDDTHDTMESGSP
ncbi:AI-2E family transporter [Acetobacter sp. DmW_043]|uniref:AI-2E family transporter n=1 Tax=Acetobacter sp. DmW_043 TaxID=1670658 RepID=UPI000A3AC5DB|nr:AI-2E family transporter [Acetobacter sp. DmW_043]